MTADPFSQAAGSAANACGVDVVAIHSRVENLLVDGTWLDSLLISRAGHVQLEEYHNEGSRDSLHPMHSVTKNWLSCLAGIALEQGLLPGLDTPVHELFSDRLPAEWDRRKASITLEHCLRMQSGLDYRNDMEFAVLFGQEEDPVAFFFGDALPVIADPGTRWWYSAADSQIIAEALVQVSGKSLTSLATQWLAEPLGIGAFSWPRQFPTPGARQWPAELGCSELQLTSRGLARLALCILQQGRWGDTQVIPGDWLVSATAITPGVDAELMNDFYAEIGAPEVPGLAGYGMHFGRMRFGDYEIIALSGSGGQYGFVIPGLDLVVVQTANFSGDGLGGGARLLRDIVLPAVQP